MIGCGPPTLGRGISLPIQRLILFFLCNIFFFWTLHFISFFNWRIIALQYCVCFCNTTTWINHKLWPWALSYVYAFPLEPRSHPTPSHHPRLSQSTGLSPLCYPATSHRLSILHMVMYICQGFPGGSAVTNLPAVQETRVRSLGQEDPLEEDMATHSSILAWRILMDREAWWAAVHRVAQSWTRPSCPTKSWKWLRSSSCSSVDLSLLHPETPSLPE